MTLRSASASLLLFAAGIAVGASWNRPTAAQAPAPPAGGAGTFQLAVGGQRTVFAVTDTRTGHTWFNYGNDPTDWRDLSRPGAVR